MKLLLSTRGVEGALKFLRQKRKSTMLFKLKKSWMLLSMIGGFVNWYGFCHHVYWSK